MTKTLAFFFFILTGLVFIYFYHYNPSNNEAFFLSCPTKLIFNRDCPLCGGQRYLYYILNLDFKNAFNANAIIFLGFPLVFYHFIAYLLKPFHYNLPTLKVTNKLLIFVLLISLLFTLIRNI